MTSSPLLSLPCDPSLLLKQLEREAGIRLRQRQLEQYRPYSKQAEFHAAGAQYRERLLMAGNQLGKTLSAGMETAMHLTGRYPAWWKGRRWDRGVVGWAAGVTGESTRDNPQRILIGRQTEYGTGAIPKDAVLDVKSASHGVADALDHIKVKHASGDTSIVYFKSYEKGREKWQGETLDFVWFDEEPPQDIYSEGLTRTNATGGIAYITFTPLLGMSEVVRRFLLEKPPGTTVITMTIDDAEHYTPEQRAAIIAAYPEHEREARAKGIPTLGSGRVFPIGEEAVAEDASEVPAHWPQIGGLDFGWDHPAAAVRIAWDRDADVAHVIACFRAREHTPLMFSGAVKPWGDWLPWSWPHDGHASGGKFDAKDQQQLSQIYRDHGLNMLQTHAMFNDGTNGVEAGISMMLERMQTGRLKVARHLSDWWEEFRLTTAKTV
jgi:phage terminase large subunit-like protein